MKNIDRPHAKPTIFGGDIRRGTVLLTSDGKPMLVSSINFTDEEDTLAVTTRQLHAEESEVILVGMNEEVPLASISTAEFLLWDFAEYATLEGMLHDSRYRGQLAE